MFDFLYQTCYALSMKNTNDKIMRVYDYIVDFVTENGFPPSVREICINLSIKSTATAYSYIEKLKSKGLLEKSGMKKRAITLTQNVNNFKSIPLLGTIRAGSPMDAIENLEGYYPIPNEFSSGGSEFALKVKGNSMINAGIYENDIIIVNQQNTANNGEIVVALVEDGVTVKRFFKKKSSIILHPENDNMQDMIFNEVIILGVVKGLMRKF